MEATHVTKNEIISELTKSPHGKLKEYEDTARKAIEHEGEFYAHLIAWNQRKGQIRDAKVALPVLQLTSKADKEFRENALANLSLLDPRNLLRAMKFARELKIPASNWKALKGMVHDYLRYREWNYQKWERVVLQHRASMKALYVASNTKPLKALYSEILFDREYPAPSVFNVLGQLKNMSPLEAAGEIIVRKIPFLVALGALGAKQKDPDLVMALIQRMSPTELVTNTKRLERLGVKTNQVLRASFQEALGKAGDSKVNANTLKTSVAVDAIDDPDIAAKLQVLQEKQIAKAPGIEGNWLVLGDKSGSMREAIEVSRHVAASLAKFVRGDVALVFFDELPRQFVVTGKTLDQIMEETKRVKAEGGTNIGCGMRWVLDNGMDIDGVVIVSDGGENRRPVFAEVYKEYARKMDKTPPVYFYKAKGSDMDALSHNLKALGVDFQTFDLTGGTDYYALPNLVLQMKANRYSLVQEILDTPLLKLATVLPRREEVLA